MREKNRQFMCDTRTMEEEKAASNSTKKENVG